MKSAQQQLPSPSFLEKLALDLIRSRKSNYVEDCIYYYFQQTKFTMEDIPDLLNNYNHLLKCTYIKHRLTLLEKVQQDFALNQKPNKIPSAQKCVVYLHGLGSNRIEGFSILPHLPKNYSLLTFDLSGSGKSQGDFTTYGFREKQDIQSILRYLYKRKNIRQFIIWGRSMGAVASLLFNNTMAQKQTENKQSQQNYSQKSKNKQNLISLSNLYQCVKCIIADSPFSSFQQISKDIALKKMSIPTFFTQIALKFLQNSFDKLLYDSKLKKCFTPFQIDFTKYPLKPVVPIVFVYSLNDQIVNCQHSEKIIKGMQKGKHKFVEKIIIPECGHNLKRPQNVIQTIFQKIDKHCQPSRQAHSMLQSKTNRIGFENSVQKRDEFIQNQTKNVRRKSFWNFEQQILDNQPSFIQNINMVTQQQNAQSQIQQKNKFSDKKTPQDNITVRKSIFNRDLKHESFKTDLSTTKKRGLSLSSTIQRIQVPIKQVNIDTEKCKQPNNKIQQSNCNPILTRPLSVQYKALNKQVSQEGSNESPRKGIVRCNAQLMDQNFLRSTQNRPSLGAKKPRISLGGSIEKNSKLKMDLFKSNAQSKLVSSKGSKIQMTPERDSTNSNNFSTISNSNGIIQESLGSGRHFQTLGTNKQNRSSRNVTGQNFESEPNIMNEQDMDFRRVSSRQSLNIIDAGQLNNEVDESLTSFINTKLQFNFEQNPLGNCVLNKFKTMQIERSQQARINKGKESIILSQIDIKQMTETTQNCNKLSTITMPSHISLRPSSRLYHQKRKKKLQAQTIMFNKQNQNVKITNQRYLFDD